MTSFWIQKVYVITRISAVGLFCNATRFQICNTVRNSFVKYVYSLTFYAFIQMKNVIKYALSYACHYVTW